MAWQSSGTSRTGTPAWKRLRRIARTALPYECARCHIDGADVPLELDHIIPVAEGGSDELDNAMWLCIPCHKVKTQAEAKRGRARQPRRRPGVRPTRTHPADVL